MFKAGSGISQRGSPDATSQSSKVYLSKVAVVSSDIGIHRVSGWERFCSIVHSAVGCSFMSATVLAVAADFGLDEVIVLRTSRPCGVRSAVQAEKIAAMMQEWLFSRVQKVLT